MVRGFSRFVPFLFLGLLRAPTRNSPERVRDTIWTVPEKSGKHPGLETPRFSFSQQCGEVFGDKFKPIFPGKIDKRFATKTSPHCSLSKFQNFITWNSFWDRSRSTDRLKCLPNRLFPYKRRRCSSFKLAPRGEGNCAAVD